MTDKTVYKVPELASMLRIPLSRAYDLVRKGEIRSIRLGRSVRIPAAELERLLGEPGSSQLRLP